MSKPFQIKKPPRRPAKPETCTFGTCDRSYYVAGYCAMHYHRNLRGQPMEGGHQREPRQGRRAIGKDGYVSVYEPDNPGSRFDGWIFEHRLVMERHIGRHLLPTENVHHRNGQRSDNSIRNLELWTRTQPSGQRASDALEWAREIEDTYGPLDAAGRL